jgi:hypothetical protein
VCDVCVCLFITAVPNTKRARGAGAVSQSPRERGETTGGKTMFSLSSVILFRKRGVDSCIFLIFTTRVDLKTRLNGVKSIQFEQCRKF